MTLIDKFNWRYATKTFDTDKKLSDEQIDTLVEAFRLSPSSYGLQPWRLVLVNNKEIREQLKLASFSQNQITDASHLFVLCRINKIDNTYVENYIREVGEAKGMTDLAPLDGYKNMMLGAVVPRSDQEAWMSKQVYIALGFMMAAAAEMQIDSCPMEGFDVDKYSEILSLKDKGLTACLVLPVGYRSSEDTSALGKKVRKVKKDIFLELN
jgi:nitroreductase / dihydropteridine reductase